MNDGTRKSTRANRSFLIVMLVLAAISSIAKEVRQFQETTGSVYGVASSWARGISAAYANNSAPTPTQPSCSALSGPTGNSVDHVALAPLVETQLGNENSTAESADIKKDLKIVITRKARRGGTLSA